MGQKVNPNGFRYGITKEYNAKWFTNKYKFADFLIEDNKIRDFISPFDRQFGIGRVVITRENDINVNITLYSSKPGVILGENGKNLEKFVKKMQKHIKNRKLKFNVKVVTIEKPELNAKLVAEEIAIKLENRGSFRIAQKFAIRNALKSGAKGIKTRVSGRLNGADMARSEGYTQGEMKLHTLRQNIDYASVRSNTSYGVIGVKVWISKGEILDGGKK